MEPKAGRGGRAPLTGILRYRRCGRMIASTLNRLSLRTCSGNTWNETRVRSARHHHRLPAVNPARTMSNY